MSETIDEKIKNYRTAPFDSRFPNTNQTRNCYQNYLGEDMDLVLKVDKKDELDDESRLDYPAAAVYFHRCSKALSAKDQDVTPCEWYKRVYKSLCPIGWVAKWDDQIENGSFPGKI